MDEHAIVATEKRPVGYQSPGSAEKNSFMGDNDRRREWSISYVWDYLFREIMGIDQD